MSILIRNGLLLKKDCRSWYRGDILVEDGRISNIGSQISIESQSIEEVVDASGKLVLPGLINAHTHSYGGLLKGMVDNVPLDIYMLYAIAAGSRRSERAIYISTMIDAIQMVKGGVTSVCDHFSQRPFLELEGIMAAVQAFRDSGMRAIVAPMFSDRSFYSSLPLMPEEFPPEVKKEQTGGGKAVRRQSAEEFIDVCEEAIRKWHGPGVGGRIRIALGTDGPQRCSEKLLRLTGELEEKYRVGWHTHILEAKTQAIKGVELYGKGIVEYLSDDLGIINERCSLVHTVWLNPREMDIIADRGAIVVHCPQSNLHLGSGIAPIPELLQKKTNVALGTDGGNLGNLSMFETLRYAILIHRIHEVDYERWIKAADILRLMYDGGARVMQSKGKIGLLERGARADIIILDVNKASWQPMNNPTNQLIFYENGSSVDTVFVEGRILLREGKITFTSEAEIFAEAVEIANRVRRDNEASLKKVEQQIPYLRKMYLRAMKE